MGITPFHSDLVERIKKTAGVIRWLFQEMKTATTR
jgi:hypothetical protein